MFADLVLMRDLNYTSICQRGNRAGHKQYRYLECIYLLTQVIKELMKGDTLLDLICTDKEEWIRFFVLRKLRFLRGRRKTKSRNTMLDFKRADLGLFRDLLGRIP